MSQMSWNCPEISNCPEIILIWSECPDVDLNLQICCHQVASFKAKMCQIRFRLGLCPRPRWGSLQRPLDGFELSNVNWTCLYMLIKVPVCFSSCNNNIYEDRKTWIFCLLSFMKPTKMSWNFLKTGSWNFTSCSWEPCNSFTSNICGIYKLHITSHKTGTKIGKMWPTCVVLTS